MQLVLQIDSGPRMGEQVPLAAGTVLRVGRTRRADLALSEDTFLSGVHFQLEAEQAGCVLRDLNSSNGTTLRGRQVAAQFLQPGDVFTAGQTQFRLLSTQAASLGEPEAAEDSAATDAVEALQPLSRDHLLQTLRGDQQPLYAVLDAARDPRILALLQEHKLQYAWLFGQGTPPELMTFAPYLVPLPKGCAALEPLVDAGWTQHWGIYLSSPHTAWEVLAFLRRLLLVDQPDGQRALFRFYDPRVLRTFLTVSEPWQWPYLFGTVKSYVMPGAEPQTAAVFTHAGNGVEFCALSLQEVEATHGNPVSGSGARPQPGKTLLQLTQGQMAALKAGERDPFEEEVLHAMEGKYPEQFADAMPGQMREWVRYGSKRSNRYGIQADGDVRLYILLMMQLGKDFDVDPALPWAAELLQRRLQPAEKLSRLSLLAQEQSARSA